MKKIFIFIFLSILTSNVFSETFIKNFDLSVTKESTMFMQISTEAVPLNIEDIKEGTTISIGNMEVETTATRCKLSINTKNNFKLKGDDPLNSTLSSYSVKYNTTAIDPAPVQTSISFNSNDRLPTTTGCFGGDLDIFILADFEFAPPARYTDTIVVRLVTEA